MKKIIPLFLLALNLASFSMQSHANPANPTNGHCQTVDPAACGWGSSQQNTGPIFWHHALAFDEQNGTWGTGSAWGYSNGNPKQLAIQLAYKDCQKRNVPTGNKFFNKVKKCTHDYTYGGSTEDEKMATVVIKAQTQDNKYRFIIRTDGDYEIMKQTAMQECTAKYNFKNCKIAAEW